jgi:hypothetical protein
MDSGLQVISTIFLGLSLKILHMNQHFQLASHLEEGCRVQDDKVAQRRVSALHERDQAHIRHLQARQQRVLLHTFLTGEGLVLIATVEAPANACRLGGDKLSTAVNECG